MIENRSLATALFIMRITLGIFFLLWAVEKIILPDTSNAIAARFYGFTLPRGLVLAVGVVQIGLVLAFMAGVFRTLTYGLMMVFHGYSTLSTWEILITPWAWTGGSPGDGIPHHLFLAAIPVLGACIALFLLRTSDTRWRIALG